MKVYRYIHNWQHKLNNIVIKTIPMIHIGTQQFYDEVSEILNDCNLILEEGIPISIDSEMGTYKRIAKKVKLFSQSQNMKFMSDTKRVNIDIEENDFNSGLLSVSTKELNDLKKFKYILPFISKKKLLKMLYDVCSYSESAKILLINPDNHYSYKHNKSPLDLLITNTRDESISRNLQEVINNNINRQYRYDIGIIFGDEHMPIIYKILQTNNFDWTLEKKIDIF